MTRHLFVLFTLLAMSSASLFAQQAAPAKMSAKFIPESAIGLAHLQPRAIMQHEVMELAPTEVAIAACRQFAGLEILDVESVLVAAGMPGPGGPEGGIVFQMNKPTNVESLSADVIDVQSKRTVDGMTFYKIPGALPNIVLHPMDSQTIFVGTEFFVRQMVSADGNSGELAALAKETPLSGEIQILLALESLKPLMEGFLAQAAAMLPPPLQGLGDILEKVDSVEVQYFASKGFQADMTLVATDEVAAEETKVMLIEARDYGKQMLQAMLPQWLPQDENNPKTMQATMSYLMRLSDAAFEILDPITNKNRVEFKTSEIQIDAAFIGVGVGLLLPAVQSAREAARRMSSSNNLKMIGLALHNYHSAYQRFPEDIKDKDGKPLLSWRVAILPFLEQQFLYEQFKLDEPWDSEHNRALMVRMPSVFHCPSSTVTESKTSYLLPTGEGIGISGNKVSFRDIVDGTSNTIMVVQVADEAHVDWTKPEDLKYDDADPMKGIGSNHVGGFHVMMADASVVFMTETIDQELVKKMMTRAGREVVDF